MYKLNKNSNSAKFYKWIWGTDVTQFKTMCPYFWKYVLTILFLPFILSAKFIYFIMPAKKKVAKSLDYVAESKVGQVTGTVFTKVAEQEKVWSVTGKILKWTYFTGIGLVVILMLILLGVAFFQNPVGGLATVGGIVLVFGGIAGLIYVFDEYSIVSKIKYPFKLFGNMIYSLYKNVCPLIKWD